MAACRHPCGDRRIEHIWPDCSRRLTVAEPEGVEVLDAALSWLLVWVLSKCPVCGRSAALGAI